MKLLDSFRNNVFEKEFKFMFNNNKLEITNYIDIPKFDDKTIIVNLIKGSLCIEGNNLTISKLVKDELLIFGNITNIGIINNNE